MTTANPATARDLARSPDYPAAQHVASRLVRAHRCRNPLHQLVRMRTAKGSVAARSAATRIEAKHHHPSMQAPGKARVDPPQRARYDAGGSDDAARSRGLSDALIRCPDQFAST